MCECVYSFLSQFPESQAQPTSLKRDQCTQLSNPRDQRRALHCVVISVEYVFAHEEEKRQGKSKGSDRNRDRGRGRGCGCGGGGSSSDSGLIISNPPPSQGCYLRATATGIKPTYVNIRLCRRHRARAVSLLVESGVSTRSYRSNLLRWRLREALLLPRHRLDRSERVVIDAAGRRTLGRGGRRLRRGSEVTYVAGVIKG